MLELKFDFILSQWKILSLSRIRLKMDPAIILSFTCMVQKFMREPDLQIIKMLQFR